LGSRKIKQVEKTPDNEKIFLDHYGWLRQKAQILLPHSKEEAEDLVQDLYVSFVYSQAVPDVDDEDRLRGYLHRTLKNLFISKGRRKGSDALSSLVVSDFDSVAYALTAIDRSRLLVVRSDLAIICEYACVRRSSHRAASVLILRFFFGYFPTELVKILQSNRNAIDKLTHTARLEARAYLTRRGSLVFMGKKPQETPLFPPHLPDNPADLNAELRRRIFSQKEGECLSTAAISERYGQSSDSTFSTSELAHIVSCSSCLDRVNEVLGLPRLSMRFFSDSNEPRDGGPTGSTGSGSSPLGALPFESSPDRHERIELQRRLRETYEHRPTALQVAVNGVVLGSTSVSSSLSEINLKLDDPRPEFVEVLSEQGRRLLYLDLMPAEQIAAEPESAEVTLSDNRILRARMTWEGGAQVVNVSYRDPLMDDDGESLSPEIAPALSAIERLAFGRIHEEAQKGIRWWRRILSPLLDADWVPILKYGSITATLCLAVALFVYFSGRKDVDAPLTANTLLDESVRSEAASMPLHGAIHRTFSFEVRSEKGAVLERGKVETYRQIAPNRRVVRLLDTSGKLQAGQWLDATGKVTDYPSARRRSAHPPAGERQTSFDEAWQHAPEADDFEQLVGDATKLSVQRESDGYDLAYSSGAASDSPTLVEARLVLASDTKRAIAETLRIRDHHETREYRFQQLTYETLPAGPVLESDFTPPSELASLHPRIPGEASAGVSGPHLTLEVLQLLSNLGPEVERIVDVERTPDGSVGINGVFPTASEKAVVQRVFEPLRATHLLTLDLHSGEDAPEPESPHKKIVLEAFDPIAVKDSRIPLDAALRSALVAKGFPEDELDIKIHVIASTVLEHCSAMHREAWNIHQIAANDFSRIELQSMQPADKMLWLTLLDKHIRGFSVELAAISSELTPLFPSDKAPPPGSTTPTIVQNIDDLDIAADALKHDSDRLDSLLTPALTLSPSVLPANHNVVPMMQLLVALQTQESRLHSTIERLQTFGKQDSIE
jgi:DNA-directed RNA polymerase specialized sigma24 family protein